MKKQRNGWQKAIRGSALALFVLPIFYAQDAPVVSANTLAPDIVGISMTNGIEYGAVEVLGNSNTAGDGLAVSVGSTSQARSVLGSSIPSGATPYTQGMDINGLDRTTNTYLDVYETRNDQVVGFHEFTYTGAVTSNSEPNPPGQVYVTSAYVEPDSSSLSGWSEVFDYTNSGAATSIGFGPNNIVLEAPNFRENQPGNFPVGDGSWSTPIDPTSQTTDPKIVWVIDGGFAGLDTGMMAFHVSLPNLSDVAPGQVVQIMGTATNLSAAGVSNIPIQLSSSAGQLEETDVVTDINGNFTFDWVAPMTPGSVTISAQAVETYLHNYPVTAQSQLTVSASAPSTHIALTISPNPLDPGQSATVTGYVYDKSNQPIANTLVNLGASSGTFSDASTTMSVQTDAAGAFKATYTAPTTTGPAAILAQIPSSNVFANKALTISVPSTNPGLNTVDPPSGLSSANVTTTGWMDSWNPVSGADSYNVYLNGAKVGSTANDVYTFTGEQPDTSYVVNVSTVSSVYESALSNSDVVETAALPPSPPSNPSNPSNPSTSPTSITPVTSPNPGFQFPTVLLQQPVDGIGGKWSVTSGANTFTVQVPNGALSTHGTIKLSTGNLLDLASHIVGLSTDNHAFGFSVEWSNDVPTSPVSISIHNTNLPENALVYKFQTDNGLTPMPAQISNGSITLSLSDANSFIVISRNPHQSVITFGNHIMMVPSIVMEDGASQTTGMPIWYVAQLLKSMGIDSTWNEHNWNLETSAIPNLSNVQVGSGNTSIYLTGTLVQKVNTKAQVDPSTNKPTTYMPIWYIQQLLNRVGLTSTWNGTTWTITD